MPLVDEDQVFRRVAHSGPQMLTSDKITGVQRPSSAAFVVDPDGISVFSTLALDELGVAPAQLLVRPGNLLVSLTVQQVRRVSEQEGVPDQPLDVLGDPWPPDVEDPKADRHGAHALIDGPQRMGTKPRKRVTTALARLAAFTDHEH